VVGPVLTAEILSSGDPQKVASGPTTQAVLAALSVLAGLLVGLGTPWLSAALSRRTGRGQEQHAVADQILVLWQRSESIRELLTDDLYGTRRNLLLLGSRLNDPEARTACLRLVHLSAQEDLSDSDVVDNWTEVVEKVSLVYRRTPQS
jgi:hypothetical protein